MTRLDGKIATVTGAASGIGRASAIAMAANGASVDVADVILAAATDVVAELRATGAEALAIKVDVIRSGSSRTDGASDREAIRRRRPSSPATLMSSPSTSRPGNERWRSTFAARCSDVDSRFPSCNCVLGGATSTRLLLPKWTTLPDACTALRRARSTRSPGMWQPRSASTASDASGIVDTPALRAVWNEAGREKMLDEIVDNHMGARIGVPEDVAAFAVFLASDESRHLTGHVITIDGGFFGHSPYYAQVSGSALKRRSRRHRGRGPGRHEP